MLEQLADWFSGAGFMPHGHCYLWRTDILLLHVGSDLITCLSYFTIPVFLYVVLKRREDLRPFKNVVILFMLFIAFCGTTHLFEVYTVWFPSYQLSGIIKLFTASVSLATAVIIWPLIPNILKIPSSADLIKANQALKEEIEERKKIEKQLKLHQEKLEELVRLRTEELETINEKLLESNQDLERFAYVASHDLQEPLRMVSSYIQLIEQKGEGLFDEKMKTYFGFAKDGAVRMSALIKALLNFSRVNKSEEKLQPIALDQLLPEVKKVFTDTGSEEISPEIILHPLPVIEGYPKQMEVIFQNLISNAIKYQELGQRAVIEIGSTESERSFTIWVKDNGIGIDMKFKDRVFDLFKRLHTQKVYQGTGIGLSICKRMLERIGGTIWFESEAGKGSTFYISIPKS